MNKSQGEQSRLRPKEAEKAADWRSSRSLWLITDWMDGRFILDSRVPFPSDLTVFNHGELVGSHLFCLNNEKASQLKIRFREMKISF